MRWQRSARLVIAVFGVVFAVFVARQLKRRDPPPVTTPVVRSDSRAIVETHGGNSFRVNGTRQVANIKYKHQYLYDDGTSRLEGVTIESDEKNSDRTFTITAKNGQMAKGESSFVLDGAVRMEGSDGILVVTEHAEYANADGTVRAPGPVDYTRGRVHATGIGMTWDQKADILTILNQAVVHVAPGRPGGETSDITSGAAVFARRDKFLRFERTVRIRKDAQNIESEAAVLYLSPDEQRIETVELHERAQIVSAKVTPGGLQAMSGAQMNLKYAANGESLEHALIAGDAKIQIAGDTGKPGREIVANTIDIGLAPDGSTPTALLGREGVQLTFPPDAGTAGHTIRAANLDAKGEPGKGLTRASFTGGVQYRERGGKADRSVNSGALDVGLKPGMSAIEDARFVHAVRFEEGKMAALSAAGHYDLDKGTLALSGTEPGAIVPHVVNEQIAVDAVTIDVTLEGPKLKAAGNVRSQLKPSSTGAKPGEPANDVKMPAMLKQDQPVNVLAEKLDYDGTASKGVYTGAARLFQGETTIKGDSIVIDNQAGNLGASGGVTTTTVLDQVGKDKKKERVHSVARAKDFKYDDAARRMTYAGDAHMSGPEGDMLADRIELFLKPSGDELERAEAYTNVVLREQNRETKGSTLIYTTANETYVVTGAPVKIVDPCQRETIGRTLTFNKGTDSIVVDGNSQLRTQTKGGNVNCTSS